MKEALAFALFLALALPTAFAGDLDALDALHEARKFDAELAGLQGLFKAADPQAAIVFRLVRVRQQLVADLPASMAKEKVARFGELLEFMKPLLEKARGSARDRATLYYWNAVVIGEKGAAKGVVEMLLGTGEIRSNCDISISIDPNYGDPYYLEALLDLALPGIAGGDLSRMGRLYAKALALDPVNIWYLTDCAISLKHRNWDARANKAGKHGVPAGVSDLDYAQELAKRANAAFAALPSPNVELRGKMDAMKGAGL
ncbi:MAG: hypothetical protein WCQ50_11545 [Spirochaetota bacterium]